jgi:hypothetical protein
MGLRMCPSLGATARRARYPPHPDGAGECPRQEAVSAPGAVDIGPAGSRVAAVTLDWPVKPAGASVDGAGQQPRTEMGGETCAIRIDT